MPRLNSKYGQHANESIELGFKTLNVEAERKLLDIIKNKDLKSRYKVDYKNSQIKS